MLNMTSPRGQFAAVIFDMDGTLIDSRLDFDAIRRDLGIGAHAGVIEQINAMPVDARRKAEEVLLSHELGAAKAATLVPGAEDLVRRLKRQKIPMALLTRNTRRAFDISAEKYEFMRLFDRIRCREDGIIKPEPDGILEVCSQMGVSPQKTLCVGDFEYDMIAARNAGAVGVLLKSHAAWQDFACHADYLIDRLDEIYEFFDF